VQFQWEPRDLWIGVFWRRTEIALHLYICLLPMVPLHVTAALDATLIAHRFEPSPHDERVCNVIVSGWAWVAADPIRCRRTASEHKRQRAALDATKTP
jgi:hypothetical protein